MKHMRGDLIRRSSETWIIYSSVKPQARRPLTEAEWFKVRLEFDLEFSADGCWCEVYDKMGVLTAVLMKGIDDREMMAYGRRRR